MKTKLIIAVILMQYCCTFSQSKNNNWIIGYTYSLNYSFSYIAKMHFQNDTFTIAPQSNSYRVPCQVSQAVISDSAGNMLFYSNGVRVANRVGKIMQNGDSLSPCPFNLNYDARTYGGLNIRQLHNNSQSWH